MHTCEPSGFCTEGGSANENGEAPQEVSHKKSSAIVVHHPEDEDLVPAAAEESEQAPPGSSHFFKRHSPFAMKFAALSRDATAVVVVSSLVLLTLVVRPSAAQFPTPAPTYECPNELYDVATCLTQNNLDPASCATCQSGYQNGVTDDTTCTGLSDLVCSQFDACTTECGPCNPESLLYYNCLLEQRQSPCVLSCSDPTPSVPTAPNPAPAPSPVSVPTSPTSTACSTEVSAFSTCVAATGDQQSCLSCLTALPDATSCTELQSNTCGAQALCPDCGDCQAEHAAAVSCLTVSEGQCDAFSCTSPSGSDFPTMVPSSMLGTEGPTALKCPDESDALATCVASGGDQASCLSCFQDYRPDTYNSCDEFESYTCGTMDACPVCGDCESELVSLTNCLNLGTCDAFNCSSPVSTSSPISSPSPASAAPGPSPVGDQCATQLNDLEGCLSTDITSGAATSCQACVTNAFQGLFPTASTRQSQPPCATINNGLCAAVFATCNCGTCSDEYETYLNCQVAELTTGCALDCSGPTGPTPAGTSSGSRAHTGLASLVLGMVALAL